MREGKQASTRTISEGDVCFHSSSDYTWILCKSTQSCTSWSAKICNSILNINHLLPHKFHCKIQHAEFIRSLTSEMFGVTGWEHLSAGDEVSQHNKVERSVTAEEGIISLVTAAMLGRGE